MLKPEVGLSCDVNLPGPARLSSSHNNTYPMWEVKHGAQQGPEVRLSCGVRLPGTNRQQAATTIPV